MNLGLRITYFNKILIGIFLSIFFLSFLFTQVYARVTPEDILNQKKEDYQKTSKNYSSESLDKLTHISKSVADINKRRTDQLTQTMITQAAILDEYESRQQGKNTEGIEEARYWITYAHEAVAYQAGKTYIIDLTSEKNLNIDIKNSILIFQSELNSTRTKVVKSQKILKDIL